MNSAKIVLRGIVVIVLDWGALILLSPIVPGYSVDNAVGALVTAIIAAALNALVWPTLSRLALPVTVLTLGAASLALNGLLVAFAAWVSPGATIDSWGAAIAVAAGIALVTTVAGSLLAIDDDDSWQRNTVRRQARRAGPIHTDVPGVLFLEIDGLAYDVLRRAMRDGNAPRLAGLLSAGSHRIECWETDWSSQTGGCQAGLLHGNNDDIPAFRWWEKDRNAAIVTNHPRDAAEIERRHSDGRGLLHGDGASRANILSGDARYSQLTMSTVLERRGAIGRDYQAYFARPYAIARTLMLAFADIARERRAAARQVREDVRPRVPRSRSYALVRAWATVVQRDLQVWAIIGDVFAGRPVVYSTFLAYDEVAHHSGIERHDALAVLREVDRQIGRIQAAVAEGPRPYEVVVLSDHGQSQGATFADRYGLGLDDLVRSACRTDRIAMAGERGDEALAYLGAGLTEVASGDGATNRAVASATRGKRDASGAVTLEMDGADGSDGDPTPPDDKDRAEVVVMASGCLGLISFPEEPGRVTRERLDELHPELLDTLRNHPGIGFVLVRSEQHGAIVLGADGTHHLDEQRVDGDDPLAPFGPNAADHVRRTDGFAHCPDIVVNSTLWSDTEEVAAFEELVGSHGGMGATQSYPFVLFPVALAYPAEPVVGAESLHRVFRTWLTALGHDGYGEPVTSAGDAGSRPASR